MSMDLMQEFLTIAHRIETTDVFLNRRGFIKDLQRMVELANELISEYE